MLVLMPPQGTEKKTRSFLLWIGDFYFSKLNISPSQPPPPPTLLTLSVFNGEISYMLCSTVNRVGSPVILRSILIISGQAAFTLTKQSSTIASLLKKHMVFADILLVNISEDLHFISKSNPKPDA
jgi:hypothetical protein